MPRFVILEHDHPVLHWDLMLEAGDVLQTWRLASMPNDRTQVIEAIALGDHRRMYLDYEGPVSGNRGNVQRRDAGVFTDETGSTPSDRVLRFAGVVTRGCWRLAHVQGDVWSLSLVTPTQAPV